MMKRVCQPKEGQYETCDECDVKRWCPIEAYLSDLVSHRDICPLDRTMEECPTDGNRIRLNPCVRGVPPTLWKNVILENRDKMRKIHHLIHKEDY